MLPLSERRRPARLHGLITGAALMLAGPCALAASAASAPAAAPCPRGRAETESAYRKRPDPALLCELAQCARADRDEVAAIDLFRRCLSGPHASVPAALQSEATAAQQQIPADAGELLLSGPAASVVLLDDRLVGVLPLSERLLLRPGEHRVTIEQGAARIGGTVRVRPGQGPRVTVVGAELQASEPFSVLVLPTVSPGAEPDAFLGPIEEALVRAKGEPLRRAFRTQVLSGRGSGPCDAACQAQLGSRAESLYVLSTEATPAPGGGYRVRAALRDVRVQQDSARKETVSAGSDRAQLAAALAGLVAEVMREGQRPIGALSLTTQPAAQVEIDGAPAGTSPLVARPLFAGDHRLRVTRRYFDPAEQTVTIDESSTQSLTIPLVPSPRTRGERFAHVGKWIFGAVGLVALGVGVGLVARGSLVSDSYEPVEGASDGSELRLEYALTTPGYALIGAGSGALLTGIALAAFDAYGQRQRRAP